MNRRLSTWMWCIVALGFATPGAGAPREEVDFEAMPPVDVAAAQKKAVEILVAASAGQDPAMRSNAIEAMQVMPERALPMTQRGLEDENLGVRFAAAVTAGMLRFEALIPLLRDRLDDPSPSVRAASLASLHILGEPVDLTPLADMLAGRDPMLRGNVAMLLGMLGEKSAIPMLKHAAGIPMPRVSADRATVARMQIAEAIAKLGDDTSLQVIRAGMYNPSQEVRLVAITATGAIGDERMKTALENFLRRPTLVAPKEAPDELKIAVERAQSELELAAAGALARLGDPAGAELAMHKSLEENPVLRAQAAWVLGWLEDPTSMKALARLLEDEVVQVRVTAAASILRRTAAAKRGPTL